MADNTKGKGTDGKVETGIVPATGDKTVPVESTVVRTTRFETVYGLLKKRATKHKIPAQVATEKGAIKMSIKGWPEKHNDPDSLRKLAETAQASAKLPKGAAIVVDGIETEGNGACTIEEGTLLPFMQELKAALAS